MLEKIKLLLSKSNDDSADELLNTLIAVCKDEAVIYCNLSEYVKALDNIVVYMVIEKYNRMGSEGAVSQSASGVSASYDSFYSEKVVRLLNKHRKIKLV
jgi:hypothetical protein